MSWRRSCTVDISISMRTSTCVSRIVRVLNASMKRRVAVGLGAALAVASCARLARPSSPPVVKVEPVAIETAPEPPPPERTAAAQVGRTTSRAYRPSSYWEIQRALSASASALRAGGFDRTWRASVPSPRGRGRSCSRRDERAAGPPSTCSRCSGISASRCLPSSPQTHDFRGGRRSRPGAAARANRYDALVAPNGLRIARPVSPERGRVFRSM